MNDAPNISTAPLELAALLQTSRFGREVEWSASLDSTNARALECGSEGAREGALVVTDHQTAGRGRHGRTWSDSPGHNLLFSVVLRPELETEFIGLIPLAAGLAIAETIEQEIGLVTELKWPNDVLLKGRKLCGVLMEGHFQAGATKKNLLVVGIGLNVNQIEFPAAVADQATSLALESGRIIPRTALLARILDRLEHRYDSLSSDGGQSVREAFIGRMVGIKERVGVSFALSPKSAEGVILGIADGGALRLQTSQGVQVLHAGEITIQGSVIEAD